MPPASPASPTPGKSDRPRRSFLVLLGALVVVLGFLFRDSFNPDLALFANDGPLGLAHSRVNALPEGWWRVWTDLNWLGFDGGSRPLTWHSLLSWLLSAWAFINFTPALASLVLGLSVWVFCRAANLRSEVGVIAGLAAALNSDFFSYACWGLPTLPMCVASVFLALAALLWRPWPWWVRAVLAGAALGHALMEGFDNGAIFSLYVAAFAVAAAWFGKGTPGQRLGAGLGSTATVAIASGLVAAHVLIGLVQANITGAASMKEEPQDAQSQTERWIFATQWSLPPRETLRALIPGLYGYRMDSPDGGQYWGTVGSHPIWDRYFASSPRRPEDRPVGAPLRFSGAGHYAGVLVMLLAAFALAQSFRPNGGALLPDERRWVWFWGGAALLSLLFAFGRFAPFYHLIYALPYFNTIRNPVKYLHPFNLSLVVLFAYGLQALWRGWLAKSAARSGSLFAALPDWWRVASVWERRWTVITCGLIGVSFFAWLRYGFQRDVLLSYLAEVGFGEDPEAAMAIARFSHREVGVFVVLLAVSIGLVLSSLSGWLSGPRARIAFLALGIFVSLDLARANTPWILHYNWRERYETNGLIDVLRAAPQEGRVTGRLPFALPGAAGQALDLLREVYAVEWHQHQFRYYDIQTLEVVQLPRPPADYVAWTNALAGHPIRTWELSNARYLLALAPLVEPINQQLDGGSNRFRLHTAFDLSQSDDGVIHVQTNASGPYALIEFTGALPRAMLFDQWRPSVPDEETLSLLPSTNFNPHAEVLVAESIPAPAVETSSQPAGTTRYLAYAPTHFTIETEARTPCVLLVNDRYDPRWKVRVDGREEPLLRANYLMRGVYLTPGRHEVAFAFEPPVKTLIVSSAAIAVCLGLLIVAFVFPRTIQPARPGSPTSGADPSKHNCRD